MTKMKGVILGVFVGLISLVFIFDLHQYLTLASVKGVYEDLSVYKDQAFFWVSLAYILVYIATAGLSIPGATVLTLLGGALFGSVIATAYIMIGATAGAALAFLSARFIFRDSLESKYGDKLKIFNNGLEKNAVQYLLFLRLVPVFPFFILNIVLGLTRISLKVFCLTTGIGMIPAIFVFANAGSQLVSIQSVGDIASPRILMAFSLLGLLALVPVLYKKLKNT